jgi:hypothetical protein
MQILVLILSLVSAFLPAAEQKVEPASAQVKSEQRAALEVIFSAAADYLMLRTDEAQRAKMVKEMDQRLSESELGGETEFKVLTQDWFNDNKSSLKEDEEIQSLWLRASFLAWYANEKGYTFSSKVIDGLATAKIAAKIRKVVDKAKAEKK